MDRIIAYFPTTIDTGSGALLANTTMADTRSTEQQTPSDDGLQGVIPEDVTAEQTRTARQMLERAELDRDMLAAKLESARLAQEQLEAESRVSDAFNQPGSSSQAPNSNPSAEALREIAQKYNLMEERNAETNRNMANMMEMMQGLLLKQTLLESEKASTQDSNVQQC